MTVSLPPIHVTHHAVQRYQERVANLAEDQVRAAIASPAVQCAASIGAPFVRLPGGQRIVVRDRRVITVLPADRFPWTLGRDTDARHGMDRHA